MEESKLASRLIYQNKEVGLTLLSNFELEGNYPNWFFDEEVNLHNSHWSRPSSFQQVNEFIVGLQANQNKLVFAVYAVNDNVHIGNISLQQIDHLNQSAEIAFLFGEKKYWGKGYATASASMVLKHGFHHLNLNRIHLGCLKKNMAMNKLAVKLGFLKEGTKRKAVFNSGNFEDVVEYGMLNDEFKKCPDC